MTIYDDFGEEFEIDLDNCVVGEPIPIEEPIPFSEEEIEFLKKLY